MKTNNSLIRLSGIAALFAATGCATMVHGTSQPATFATAPWGASVTIDGQPRGVTPVRLDLSRRSDHTVKIALDGFEPLEFTIKRHGSGWAWANLLWGLSGVAFVVVDAATGAIYNLDYNVAGDSTATPAARRVVTVDETLVIKLLTPGEAHGKQIGALRPRN